MKLPYLLQSSIKARGYSEYPPNFTYTVCRNVCDHSQESWSL